MKTTPEKLEKKISNLLQTKDFQSKYLKNIVVDFCHGQSYIARTEVCDICKVGISKKELKKMTGRDYGIVFGQLYNKRHKKKNLYSSYSSPKYFGCFCQDCVEKIEKSLDYIFKKSYAS